MCYSICCFIIFAKVEHTAKANLSPTVYYSNKIRAPHSHTRIMIAKDFLNEMKITVCCDVQKYVLTLSEVNYSLKSGWNKLKITFKIWQIKNLTECELFMFWKYPTISKIVYDDNRYYFGSLSTIKLSWSYITSDIKYQNGWLKYDHRVMYKKYTTSLPFYGMWGSRKTSWDGPANKKLALVLQILFLRNKCNFLKLPKFMVKYFGTY